MNETFVCVYIGRSSTVSLPRFPSIYFRFCGCVIFPHPLYCVVFEFHIICCDLIWYFLEKLRFLEVWKFLAIWVIFGLLWNFSNFFLDILNCNVVDAVGIVLHSSKQVRMCRNRLHISTFPPDCSAEIIRGSAVFLLAVRGYFPRTCQ